MIIEGKVVDVKDDNWSFTVGQPPKTLHQFTIAIENAQGIRQAGKYTSVSKEQTTFVIGQMVKVEVEVKTSKNGTMYNKFKLWKDPAARQGRGNFNDPVVNAQIERMTSLAAAIELSHYYTIEVGKWARALNQFIVNNAKNNGGTKQSSIIAQSSLKSAIQTFTSPKGIEMGLPVVTPTIEQIITKAEQYQQYIIKG